MFGNMGDLMKKAQEMQKKMDEAQQKLAEIEVEGQAAGGMIKTTLNGKGELKGVKIDKPLVDPEDVEVLEDLILAAVNDGKARAEEKAAEEMGKVTGGMGLPGGMKLPF